MSRAGLFKNSATWQTQSQIQPKVMSCCHACVGTESKCGHANPSRRVERNHTWGSEQGVNPSVSSLAEQGWGGAEVGLDPCGEIREAGETEVDGNGFHGGVAGNKLPPAEVEAATGKVTLRGQASLGFEDAHEAVLPEIVFSGKFGLKRVVVQRQLVELVADLAGRTRGQSEYC